MSHIVVLHTEDNVIYVPSDKILMFGANMDEQGEHRRTIVRLVDSSMIFVSDTCEHIMEELKYARRLLIQENMR